MFHIFSWSCIFLFQDEVRWNPVAEKTESIRDLRGWQAKAFKFGTGGMQLRGDEGV